jgi:sporulation integral membrane protein YtvI
MFNAGFIQSLRNFIIFLLLYSVVFIAVCCTISFTYPFIAAFIIAFLIQPITVFFKKKLNFKKNMPSMLASITVYFLLFIFLSILFYSVISEVRQLAATLSHTSTDYILKSLSKIILEIGAYLRNIDPSFIEKNSSHLTGIFNSGIDILNKGLSTFLALATSLPMWITVIFMVMISTYFFSRDMAKIRSKIFSIFSDKSRSKIEKVWHQCILTLSKYIKAYSFILSLTFIITLVGFLLLGVRYSVVLSVICAFADILPVLGTGLVFLPLSLIYILLGNYYTSIGILALFLLIITIRQFVESKIISASLGLHPLLVMVSIFAGMRAFGMTGVLYFIFLSFLYKILKASGIL